jgi:hypothetical protein
MFIFNYTLYSGGGEVAASARRSTFIGMILKDVVTGMWTRTTWFGTGFSGVLLRTV